jgi:hypothetical protein
MSVMLNVSYAESRDAVVSPFPAKDHKIPIEIAWLGNRTAQFIFSTSVLIRHLWKLKTVVFLHRCLLCAVLF